MLALPLMLTGCAVTSLEGQRMPLRSEAFADYVEIVFRQQNEVSTELGFALDGADPEGPGYAELEAAEMVLIEACRGLNELARGSRAGEDIGGLGAMKRARQAPECEQAAQTAADVVAGF